MKTTPTIIICAILSLSLGIAAASPLLVTELEIRPWITQVQGPTTEFDIDIVYANFTVQNPNLPLTVDSGPTISYFAVINLTNPSDYPAYLTGVSFWAGQKILNTTNQFTFEQEGNWGHGEGWDAKGAWVDGTWYNVSWVDGTYPYFDENGTMTQWPFPVSADSGYWMEGVQVYQRTIHNNEGTNVYTYLNMNGTWTDVTGRITVDTPENGPSYRMTGSISDKRLYFQSVALQSENFTLSDRNLSFISTKNVWAGEGAFDNLFEPNESHLIVLAGSWEARKYSVDTNPIDTLQAGNIQLMIKASTDVNINCETGNNTILETWTDSTVIKQITVTQTGNSYIYNTELSENQMFRLDQFSVEAFIVPRS